MAAARHSYQSFALIAGVAYLLLVGVIIQFSIHANTRGVSVDFRPTTQLLAIGLGLLLAFSAWRWPLSLWLKLASTLFLMTLILLALVKRFGVEVYGAQRWILIGGFQLQPSELAKPLLSLIGARLMIRSERGVRWQQIVRLLLSLGLPVALVVTQPDIGTALVLVTLWLAQLAISDVGRRAVTILLLCFIGVGVVGLQFVSPYQRSRVTTFLHNDQADAAATYNVAQARIAVGSGGLTGRGLSGGSQSQLNFLPAQHTDFIFSVVAEKLGMLGALSVIVVEFVVIWLAWRIVSQTEQPSATLFATGLATILSVQVVINLGMNLGLLPVTGIPLPFVSYGGTSIVVSLMIVGFLLNIARTHERQRCLQASSDLLIYGKL